MSMFMASMVNAAKNGELDGMGMFGAALKRDVAEYERRLEEDRAALTAALSGGSDAKAD